MGRDMNLSEERALAICEPALINQLEIVCTHQKTAHCILQRESAGISLHILTPKGSYSLYCQRNKKRYFKRIDAAVNQVAKLGLDGFKMIGIKEDGG